VLTTPKPRGSRPTGAGRVARSVYRPNGLPPQRSARRQQGIAAFMFCDAQAWASFRLAKLYTVQPTAPVGSRRAGTLTTSLLISVVYPVDSRAPPTQTV
jgi:hypothetical protein